MTCLNQEFDLEGLARSTKKHRALDNEFYNLWTRERLPFEALEVYAHNYVKWIETVPDQIARSFLSVNELPAKCETVKNLFSEMGYGDPEKSHLNILKVFLNELLTRAGGRPYVLGENPELILPSTTRLIKEQRWLFGHELPQISSGALLAQEWQAYTMLVKLYEGTRLYADLWEDPDDFHEACEYFYIHIGDAEKEHKILAVNAALKYLHTQDDFETIRDGWSEFLELLYEFWEGIAAAMKDSVVCAR